MNKLTATEFMNKLQDNIKKADKLRLSKKQKVVLEREINEIMNHAIDRILLSV